MATIKNKGAKAKLTSPARAIHSIIVPLRKKNRPPTIALQDFQNRTITANLFPNVYCSVSELPAAATGIIDIWRKILNSDIRYQQQQNALPAFLGCRDLCCKFSSATLTESDVFGGTLADFDTYPYLRLTMDNIQVAVFIIMSWCRRTGQLPRTYDVTYVNNGKLYSTTYYIEKSNPYLFEKLMQEKHVESIKFGAAAEIINAPTDRNEDLYNIPGIRVSQKFGHQLNVYAQRKIKEYREALQRGELKRLKVMRSAEHNRTAAKLEYNQHRARLQRSAMGFSNYGGYAYHTFIGTRYARAYYRTTNVCPEELTEKTNEALAAIHAPELLKPIVGAETIIEDIRILEEATRKEQLRRIEVEEELQELKESRKANVEAAKIKAMRTNFRNKTQLRNYALTEASMLRDCERIEKNCRNVSSQQLTDAITTIIQASESIEIDRKDGQLIIKF